MKEHIEIYDLADLALVWNAVSDTAAQGEMMVPDKVSIRVIRSMVKDLMKSRDRAVKKTFGREDTSEINYKGFKSDVLDFLFNLDEEIGKRRGTSLLLFKKNLKKDIANRV